MQPENKSKYTCRNAGTPILRKIGINPYQSARIMVPDGMLAKRRSDMDSGVASSPIQVDRE